MKTQTKQFFNNALNSLSNLGDKIKDQIQNVKDTVIDTIKGNDLNTNYNINYKANSIENNYPKQNYNDNIDINNNNEKKINYIELKQKEEKEVDDETRKTTVDSTEELEYNKYYKQDIMDIVNKLKEFDTKYNMFFNDEDKKNFRIIINYLNKNT